jgi:hypothetical protein
MQKIPVWIGVFLLAVAIGASAYLEARKRAAHSVSAIRQKYRDYPPDILGVSEPITFDDVSTYEDGGTKSITLTDATGKKFQACLDGRDWGGPYDMYIGAAYPTHEEAQKVAKQGPEEAAFFGLLIRWCEADPERLSVYGMNTEQFVAWANRNGKSDRREWSVGNACGLLMMFERRFGCIP